MVQIDSVVSTKPVLVFTFPDCIGGVANFNRNIINYSSLRNLFYIKVILLRSREDDRQPYSDSILADELFRFSYSVYENQYYVCKRLNNLVGNETGCIITDNSLTLNTASLCKNQKQVLYLVHDYFYVSNALQYESTIDAAIAHSSFFKDILCAALPGKYFSKSFFIPYGIERPASASVKSSTEINLIFLGRLVKEKGVLLLREIESILSSKGIPSKWTIIGSGPCEKPLRDQWKDSPNILFANPDTTGEVYAILNKQDVLVLPTIFEGTPVSILESLANGVVPVVSDLPGGIRDIVNDNIGYRCAPGEASQFASAIMELYHDKNKLHQLQANGIAAAASQYDIVKNADKYFSLFTKYAAREKKDQFGPVLFSKLDQKQFPDKLVYFIRKTKARSK